MMEYLFSLINWKWLIPRQTRSGGWRGGYVSSCGGSPVKGDGYSQRSQGPCGESSNSNATKERLMKGLQEIKDMKSSKCTGRDINCQANKVLFLIFHAGRKDITFTEREQREFGELLIDTFRFIRRNIKCTLCVYRSRLDTAVLMKRSALQFLLEKYADFPARNSTVGSELEKANIREIIKEFNNRIQVWSIPSGSSDENSDLEGAGASDVPKTHIWWSM